MQWEIMASIYAVTLSDTTSRSLWRNKKQIKNYSRHTSLSVIKHSQQY